MHVVALVVAALAAENGTSPANTTDANRTKGWFPVQCAHTSSMCDPHNCANGVAECCPDGSVCPGSTCNKCECRDCGTDAGHKWESQNTLATCPGTDVKCQKDLCLDGIAMCCPDGSVCPGSTCDKCNCPKSCDAGDGKTIPGPGGPAAVVLSHCLFSQGVCNPNNCQDGMAECCADGYACPNHSCDKCFCHHCNTTGHDGEAPDHPVTPEEIINRIAAEAQRQIEEQRRKAAGNASSVTDGVLSPEAASRVHDAVKSGIADSMGNMGNGVDPEQMKNAVADSVDKAARGINKDSVKDAVDKAMMRASKRLAAPSAGGEPAPESAPDSGAPEEKAGAEEEADAQDDDGDDEDAPQDDDSAPSDALSAESPPEHKHHHGHHGHDSGDSDSGGANTDADADADADARSVSNDDGNASALPTLRLTSSTAGAAAAGAAHGSSAVLPFVAGCVATLVAMGLASTLRQRFGRTLPARRRAHAFGDDAGLEASILGHAS